MRKIYPKRQAGIQRQNTISIGDLFNIEKENNTIDVGKS